MQLCGYNIHFILYHFILKSNIISSVAKLVENSIINKIMCITTKYVIVIFAILKLFEV